MFQASYKIPAGCSINLEHNGEKYTVQLPGDLNGWFFNSCKIYSSGSFLFKLPVDECFTPVYDVIVITNIQ